MSSSGRCYVYIQLPGTTEVVTCGRFQLQEVEPDRFVGRFVYGRSYRGRSDAVALDPIRLPLSDRVYETARLGGLFGAIRDALPDYWGRRVLERRLGRDRLSDFELLMHPSPGRIGALSFGEAVEPPTPEGSYPPLLELERIMEAARRLEDELADDDGLPPGPLLDLLEPGSSLGGARPKALVRDAGELWVAKFPMRSDRWSYAPVEAAMLALARGCGIRVPEFRVVEAGGRKALLVRRFDREEVEGGTLRHRMVSAMTVLEADESPTARTNWSYPLLADELRRWSGAFEADRRELFRRMTLNALVSNTDDHPRNHALVAPGRAWRLSPAYDLTPSPQVSRDQVSREVRYLAMECGEEGRAARRTNLLSMAPRFGYSRDEANEVVDEIRDRVAGGWREAIVEAGGTERDLERVAPAVLYPGFE